MHSRMKVLIYMDVCDQIDIEDVFTRNEDVFLYSGKNEFAAARPLVHR
jgi:hypothetical protein